MPIADVSEQGDVVRELSLHILDLVQNSLRAGARLIEVEVVEDSSTDRLIITVKDDGCGMDAEFVKKVLDPFTTTRTTRKVGLGLSLLHMAAKQCNGDLSISSKPGKGTTVRAEFQHSHIDRMPLGDMMGTILTVILSNPELNIVYRHRVDEREWEVDTRVIKSEVGSEALTLPPVVEWLRGYLDKGQKYLYGGVGDEVSG